MNVIQTALRIKECTLNKSALSSPTELTSSQIFYTSKIT